MTLLFLATGGTIASRVDASGAVVPAVAPEELLDAVPGLDRLGAIQVEEIDRVNGWNVTPATMVRVAERAREALEAGDADGVVVTHGTDTVEETLYLTDLLAGAATSRGGIVFACAMRASSDLGADGPRNLRNAAVTALDPAARGRGALLSVNDELHAARWVTKTDTTNVSTFRSPGAGPVGGIEHGRPRFAGTPPPRPPRGQRVDFDVALITAYSGMAATPVRRLIEDGVRGLVVQGTGAGNVPGTLVPALAEAIEAGVAVVIASRCWTGRTVPIYGGPGGGVTLRDLGVVGAGDLPAHKARLGLMVALGLTRDLDGVRDWFDQATGAARAD
jgi:L-asparaginase